MRILLNLTALPMRERGLKYLHLQELREVLHVAPHVGAWIEICITSRSTVVFAVAPHAGAWIEIENCLTISIVTIGRSPCGSVD